MKAVLRFDMDDPDEEHKFRLALNASQYADALETIRGGLRNIRKHESDSMDEKTLDRIEREFGMATEDINWLEIP